MLSPETKNIQKKLADYARTGKLSDIPGTNTHHVKQYRRLVFNIIRNNIFQAFPIATNVIGKHQFTQMIDDFFSTYNVKTSQIWLLPGEFYEFVKTNNWNEKYSLPWLADLLLLEWTEIFVHTMPDSQTPETKKTGNILQSKSVINPDYKIIKLTYPVHIKSVKETIKQMGNYYVLIFRHPVSGKVQFLNLTILHVTLIEYLAEKHDPLIQILPKLLSKFRIQDHFMFQKAIKSFVIELVNQKFILGFLSE